jgi:hypothetical protein
MVDAGNYMRIDFEGRAIELLINEINKQKYYSLSVKQV